MRVHHVAVQVSDLERSEAFYGEILDLPVRKRWFGEDGKARSIWLELGEGAFLALECTSSSGRREPDDPGWHCVALGIAAHEREAWRHRLKAASIPIVRESPYTLYVHDPDGNLVGLSHYPEMEPEAWPTARSK